MQAGSIEGGFASPVFDAQGVFRAVMDALAQPGTVQATGAAAQPPAPLSATAAAIALTLCDHDTPVWLDPALAASEAVVAWLGFHTGAPVVGDPAQARFAIVADAIAMPALAAFAAGTQDYPDRSTTLIVHVENLDRGAALTLRGPGIETLVRLSPAGLPANFITQWVQNNALFPRGVDVIFAAPDAIAALPRTTRIEAKGA